MDKLMAAAVLELIALMFVYLMGYRSGKKFCIEITRHFFKWQGKPELGEQLICDLLGKPYPRN